MLIQIKIMTSAHPSQSSLFDEGKTAVISEAFRAKKPVDKNQAAFQRLIRQIDALRGEIETWRAYQTRHAERVAQELLPLMAKLRERRRSMVFLLDEMFDRPGAIRGKRMREKLQSLIVELLEELLAENPEPDLIALNDRHSDLTHAEMNELDMALHRDMVEHMFGVRMGEGEAATPQELLEKAMQEMQERSRQAAEKQQMRKKSPKSEAAEAKRAEAEKQVSQSVRAVYRKLASALHPDRVSEGMDYARKTALMQRVNKAYDEGNLLDLLTVQLEIEQIDADHLSSLPTERVKHYNAVLKEQLAELKTELDGILEPFRMFAGFVYNLTPRHVDQAFSAQISSLNQGLEGAEIDLVRFQDPKQLCADLKKYKPENHDMDFLEGLIPLFLDLSSAVGKAPPPRRTKNTARR